MSAFLCDQVHISALAAYAEKAGLGDAEKLDRVLFDANCASLRARYPRDPENVYPGFEKAGRNLAAECSPVAIIKSARCFEYQACEWNGWEGSDAQAVIRGITGHAETLLPGYEEALWGAPAFSSRAGFPVPGRRSARR